MSVHSYYEHKRTESVKLPYSFKCEHCMSDSGPMWATVTGYGTKDSLSKKVDEKSEEKMRREAHRHLVKVLRQLHKDIVQKQAFTEIFTDECPHCHKPQSWGISIAKEGMLATPLAFLIVSIFLGAGSLMGENFGEINSKNIPIAIGLVALGVVAAAGSLVWKIIKVNKKKKIANMGSQKNLPVIDWKAVQYLLDDV